MTTIENQVAENQPTAADQKTRLVDITVVDDNVALNLMVAFLNMAQRRGAYSMDESAKIWECVRRFIRDDLPTEAPATDSA